MDGSDVMQFVAMQKDREVFGRLDCDITTGFMDLPVLSWLRFTETVFGERSCGSMVSA